jgi:Pvc16 N-terminal domain
MYTSIIATSESLRELLRDSFHSDLGPSGLAAFFTGAMDVSLATPREMQGTLQGLSLWLYHVERDETRLNDPPTVRPLPDGSVETVPPPLPMRLHYLMTPLVDNGPDTEQRILGRVLQLFHMHPTLSGADLRGDLTGTAARINVRLEALSLAETSRVWEALGDSFQLAVSYEVTLANIDNLVQPAHARLIESVHPSHALRVAGPV